MSAIPVFQIGVWNAWILLLLVFVTMFTPNLFLSEEGVRRNLGLHGMAERATLLGGTFTIRSQPGQGTYVHGEVPLVEGDINHE